MSRRLACLVALELAGICIASWLVAGALNLPDLTVHEWGTFTAIAGKNGHAVEWQPLPSPGTTDLPRFVEHLSRRTSNWGYEARFAWRRR